MTMPPVSPALPGRRSSLFALAAALAGGFAMAGGFFTLVGWAFEIPRLTDWADRGISMFPNAAMCGMACGAALLIEAIGKRGAAWRALAYLLVALCAVLAGLTALQHATGWNIGIDTLLFSKGWGQAASTAPMRMGVPATTAYLLLSICLTLLTLGPTARKAASVLAIAPVGVASLSITGYWFRADQLFGVARYTGISFQTAVIIALLGLGIMAALPEYGLMALIRRRDPGGVVARRLLLPLIFIPLLLGWLRLLGQQAGFYDAAFGTAVRTLLEIGLFLFLLWWTAESISRHAGAAHKAEEALRSSEERFVRFMQSLPGLAWIKDMEGRYLYANDAAEKAFGRSKAEFYGRTDPEIFPSETAAAFVENDRRAVANGSAGLQIVEILEQEGEIRHSLVSKFPILGPTGAPVLVGGMAIDVTDRMKAEAALREADRRKDEFLATLAHELRNPLAPIRMAVQLFKAGHAAENEHRWALEVIDRQVQQMVRLLDDLLDVSRISYGKLELREERVDLAVIIRRAVETSRPALDEGGHLLEVRLPSEPIFLDADPVRLGQVFSNLLNNAAKFTPKGGRVEIAARRAAGGVEVAVRDNGQGIPAEKLSSIFEIFAQAEPSKHSGGGLGIGLSLVKGLVELHRGRIEASSQGPGRGSEFTVCLPAALGGARAAKPADSAVAPGGRGGKRRILVADDLADNANSISIFLVALGHEVHTAYDGQEAVDAATRLQPDVVLLDIGMPKLDGNEVCRRIRAQEWGRKALVVAITGWGQAADRQKTTEAGFDHHLVKPVNPSTLADLLGKE